MMRTATKQLLTRHLEVYGPDTAEQLALELGLTRRQLNRVLRELHETERVYIKGYESTDRGPRRPIYAFGYGVDAKPPRPLTGAVKAQVYRQRQAHEALRRAFA